MNIDKIGKWIALSLTGVLTVVIGFTVISLANMPPLPPYNPAERIQTECEREYRSHGDSAVASCRLAITARMIVEGEERKLSRTHDRARFSK